MSTYTALNFRIPPAQADALDELADSMGLSRSEMLRQLVADAVADHRGIDRVVQARAQIKALWTQLGDPGAPIDDSP